MANEADVETILTDDAVLDQVKADEANEADEADAKTNETGRTIVAEKIKANVIYKIVAADEAIVIDKVIAVDEAILIGNVIVVNKAILDNAANEAFVDCGQRGQ